jgi:hypothetical protein
VNVRTSRTATRRSELPPGALRHPVVAVGLGLIVLQLCFRAWALYPSWFYFDDYRLLRVAKEEGLTSSYLLSPENSHLMPGTRLIYWLVAESGVLNWGLAATITLVLQLLASVACLWMLVTLFGPRWPTVGLLSLYLTSAITAQSTMWWIAAVNEIPVQAAFFLAVCGWVQYLRTRRVRWLVLTAAAVALGLCFYQKILLVLPVLVFLAFAYFAGGSLVARFRYLVRRYWPAVVVMGVVCGGYLAYYLVRVDQPFVEDADTEVSGLVSNMLQTALSGALGGPWGWQSQPGGAWADTPELLQGLAWVAATIVIGLSVLTRKGTWPAWVLLGSYLGFGIILVATTRAPVFGPQIGLAYRLQTDLVCALVLCLGLVFMTLPGSVQSSERRADPGVDPHVAAQVGVGALVLVSVSGLASWAAFARDWQEHNASESYLRTLGDELRRRGGVDLLDTAPPDTVLPAAFFAPDDTVSTLTTLMDADVRFPKASPDLAMVSETGTLHQAMIEPAVRGVRGPLEDCGWKLTPNESATIPLEDRTYDWGWWVRIGYLASNDSAVTVSAGDDEVETRVERGPNSLYVQLTGAFDELEIAGLDAGTTLCVDTVEVGNPEPGAEL